MTGRGWSMLGLAAGMALWSRLVGTKEVFQVALAIAVLCLGSAIWVRFRSRNLLVERSLPQPRIHRGEALTIHLTVHNRDSHPTPTLTLIDRFPDPPGSLLIEVASLAFGEHEFQVAAVMEKRGRHLLKGIEAAVTDPYRIAKNRRKFPGEAAFLVYPKVETLPVPGVTLRPSGRDAYRRAPASQGEDFYGVRDYRTGDDPRKIHWPSTARLGTLMVREEEVSAQDRMTVLLDDRAAAHTPESFEWAADAAASIADLYLRMDIRVGLASPGGSELSPGRGSIHYGRLMEELAIATLRPATEARLLALARRGREDVLAIVSGEMGAATAAGIGKIAGRYRETIVIFPPGLQNTANYGDILRRAGLRVVAPLASQTLSDAWEASTSRQSWTAPALI